MGVVGAAIKGFGKALTIGKRNKASKQVFDHIKGKPFPPRMQEKFRAADKRRAGMKKAGYKKEPYADTLLCPDSKNAILRSCGAGIAAANNIMKDNDKRIFCAVRPPGHHAETVRANGFCFINNIAVAARYLQNEYEINKVAIIDFDVHHGNGTQEIFFQDKTVAYGSIHEFPLFPGTGSEQEIGIGNIFNAPIVAGTEGKGFIKIFEDKILENMTDCAQVFFAQR